jgi:hypothetical protein
MHTSRIIVDLPSAETERRKGPLEWVRALLGAQLDLRSGREELTVGTLWLIEGMVDAFAVVGVRDVSSFTVDKQVVYLDTEEEVPDDLPLLVRAAEVAGVLDRKFHEMSLVLVHDGPSLHTAIDCRIKNGVLLGEAEMMVVLSGEPRGPAPGGAGDGGGAGADAARRELDALTERIANELGTVLRGARVTREAAVAAAGAPLRFS